jgi:hypothetical protein
MVDDERTAAAARRGAGDAHVRFRTLGCYPLTGAVESDAATLEDIIAEMLTARTSERQGRLIDHDERFDGEEEARGLFLMATTTPLRKPRDQAVGTSRLAPLKGLLRFLTCGSVDDGKSTLIGRLLYDTKLIFEDQLAALRSDRRTARPARTSTSRCWSTAWRPSASRASPSTSPTAISRPTSASSSSPTRPGHEQYTRNMATGASTPISPSS